MRRFGRRTSWRGHRRSCSRPPSNGARSKAREDAAPATLALESPPRAVRRFIPKQAVTVSVNEDGFPLAWGEVRDLSESGACVVTDLVLQRGWRIDLRVSLNRLGEFETRGHVIWSGEGPGAHGGVLGGVLHGVQFTGLSEDVRARLKGLLVTSAFDVAPTTLWGATDRTPFQDMLEALQPELDRLGIKMD